MDSGWAVVLGATIALIGSSLVPWVREAAARRSGREYERRAAIRKLVPELLGLIRQHHENHRTRMWDQGLAAKETKVMVQLTLLLKPNEWPVSGILAHTSDRADHEDGAKVLAAASTALAVWFSGARSLDVAVQRFEYDTEIELTRP